MILANPNMQADDIEGRIVAALELLPERDRKRDPLNAVHRHIGGWCRAAGSFDPAPWAEQLADAKTVKEFDRVVAEAEAARVQAEAGVALRHHLTERLGRRRVSSLKAETGAIAERLRPVVTDAMGTLTAAAAELPSGQAALDAAAVLAADAGDPWRRAHDAIGVLLTVAALAPQRNISDAATHVRHDHRHLAPLLSLLEVDDAGPQVRDINHPDVTAVVDPPRATRLAAVRQFVRDTRDLSAADVLVSVAQRRWGDAVKLGYSDPTGAATLAVLHHCYTSRMVNRDEMRANTGRPQSRRVINV